MVAFCFSLMEVQSRGSTSVVMVPSSVYMTE